MTDNQMFDIGSLHAAYAAERPVSEMIETVFARIEAVADPASSCIWPIGRPCSRTPRNLAL